MYAKLLIVGCSRSGTTILDQYLSSQLGFFSAGESLHLWRNAQEGRLCGCGRPLIDCPVWAAAYGDPPSWEALEAAVAARSMWGWTRGEGSTLVRSHWERVETVASGTDALGITDSSKKPGFASLTLRVGGPEVAIVWIVRSVRGVWRSQRVPKLEPGNPLGVIGPLSRRAILLGWIRSNALSCLVLLAARLRGRPVRFVRFKTFQGEPGEVSNWVAGVFSLELKPPEIDSLLHGHTAGGNPDRLTRVGRIEVNR